MALVQFSLCDVITASAVDEAWYWPKPEELPQVQHMLYSLVGPQRGRDMESSVMAMIEGRPLFWGEVFSLPIIMDTVIILRFVLVSPSGGIGFTID